MYEATIRGKTVNRREVLEILSQFRSDYPNTNDYDSWLEKDNYQYALVFEDRVYPPKHILGEAAGISLDEFSGGSETNRVFRQLGFEIVNKPLDEDPLSLVNTERARRYSMWQKLIEEGGPVGVLPQLLRDIGIYGGAQGIWVDKKQTGDITSEDIGVTVSVLHRGSLYPDDLLEEGIIYHYPDTARAGKRDELEIEATKAARRLDLPVFVITQQTPSSTTRDIQLGWVEDWSDEEKAFLIVFQDEAPPTPPDLSDDDPFGLTEEEEPKMAERLVRTGQQRFRMRVIRQYGARCALCPIKEPSLLDAVHIYPKRDGGTDDPRNGLVLCALHHRALDSDLLSIHPETLLIQYKPSGPQAEALLVSYHDISHLPNLPHYQALDWHWRQWEKKIAL